MARGSHSLVRFGVFEVDLDLGEIRKQGMKVKLHRQPFEILAKLLGRPGEIVTREELRQKLWPEGTFVDFDGSLNVILKKLRAAIDDDSDNPRFIETVASQVVVGLFRASPLAPAQLFYAHVHHADLAAHIAIADSMLQEHRGFPLLIDLAHHVCAGVFGGTLRALTGTAYAAAGAPWRYDSERTTRDH